MIVGVGVALVIVADDDDRSWKIATGPIPGEAHFDAGSG
jgi:hypothetical protein